MTQHVAQQVAQLAEQPVPVLTPRAAREQRTFRALLDAMARPGTIASVELDSRGGRLAAAVTLLEALVDHEVTFAITPGDAAVEEAVLRLTGARIALVATADYVVADGAGIAAALDAAKEGQPEYPDRGATVVVVVESIAAVAGVGEGLSLAGPGIRDTTEIWVDGFGPEFRELLAERNRELPLGLDIVLLAAGGSFTCLPRYTRITASDVIPVMNGGS